MLSLRRLTDIQWPISDMHSSSRAAAAVSNRTCGCGESVDTFACHQRMRAKTHHASPLRPIGPLCTEWITDPQIWSLRDGAHNVKLSIVSYTVYAELSLITTRKVLPDRYDLNQSSTTQTVAQTRAAVDCAASSRIQRTVHCLYNRSLKMNLFHCKTWATSTRWALLAFWQPAICKTWLIWLMIYIGYRRPSKLTAFEIAISVCGTVFVTYSSLLTKLM